MMIDFSNWLTNELNKRGWSNSELARRSGVVQSTISMLISKQQKPSADTLIGISRALRIPRERVFRAAGLLPRVIGDVDAEELMEYYKNLDHRDQDTVLKLARVLYEQKTEYKIKGET